MSQTDLIDRVTVWAENVAPEDRALAGLMLGLYMSHATPIHARRLRHELEATLAGRWGKVPEQVETMIVDAMRRVMRED